MPILQTSYRPESPEVGAVSGDSTYAIDLAREKMMAVIYGNENQLNYIKESLGSLIQLTTKLLDAIESGDEAHIQQISNEVYIYLRNDTVGFIIFYLFQSFFSSLSKEIQDGFRHQLIVLGANKDAFLLATNPKASSSEKSNLQMQALGLFGTLRNIKGMIPELERAMQSA